MGTRVQLQVFLEDLIGSSNVYFQPPESKKMVYPCIVYSHSSINTRFADNIPYNHQAGYMLTLIDKDPDSSILDKIKCLPMCKFDRHYTSDNLNHYVFNLYY